MLNKTERALSSMMKWCEDYKGTFSINPYTFRHPAWIARLDNKDVHLVGQSETIDGAILDLWYKLCDDLWYKLCDLY